MSWRRDAVLFTAGLYLLSGATYAAGLRPLGAVVWAPLIGLAACLAADLHLSGYGVIR